MKLCWHPYSYYPYEKDLALREANALICPKAIKQVKNGLMLDNPANPKAAKRLVYFSEVIVNKVGYETVQATLENTNQTKLSRQSTRYSAHGLHEYKGKFNPQIAKAILNILGKKVGANILDPFCGSGTSLVECAHHGMKAIGLDINPLAIYIANSKIAALHVPAKQLREELRAVLARQKKIKLKPRHDERWVYLSNWFSLPVLDQIEKLKVSIDEIDPICGQILLAIASNLLREYSQQDPRDLRIRRRKSELPSKPFVDAFFESAELFISKIESMQVTLGNIKGIGKAILGDSRDIKKSINEIGRKKFDCALTSPPYATALPYIDTQRLSLVWLELTPPSDLLELESRLIGSREIRGRNKKSLLLELNENHLKLPIDQFNYCLMLKNSLSSSDGFRRQAVPILLYRYFVDMSNSFRAVRSVMKDGAHYALIVGGNHTVLGGKRYDIDTPAHLAGLSKSCGWHVQEIIPLQTYQRYGYNINNAINSEALIILEAR